MIGEFFIISKTINSRIRIIFNNDKDKILDLGCGSKPYYYKSTKGKIICFDNVTTKITNVVGDADKLPFKANAFDKIISVNSFYYFKNPFNVVENLHRILKNNGKLVLIIPFFYPIHDVPIDRYRFTEYGLKTMLEECFKIERIKTIGGIFNLPAIILHSLIKGLPLLFPRFLRIVVKLLVYIFYPLYITAQIFSLLDVFDKTDRFPTYYFVVASKK